MAQIILIEPNNNFRDLLTLNLGTYTGAEVIPRQSAIEAIDLLNILPQIELIITRDQIDDEQTVHELIKHINENNLSTTIIAVGESSFSNDSVVTINEVENWEKIIKSTLKILGINEDILSKKVLADYLPIPIHYFYAIESTCCDIFIRIKKGADDYQYIKRLHQGDNFTAKTIDRYKAQGLDFLYIPKDYQKNFTNYLSDHLIQKIDQTNDSVEEKIEVLGQSFDLAMSEIKNLGFTSATIQLTDKIIDSIIETVNQSETMSPILHKVLNSKTSYLYQSGHIACIIATQCLEKLGRLNDQVVQSIGHAAFFHDITLFENEELAKISSYQDLEQANLNEEDWELVFHHAIESSRILSQYPEVPPEAIEMVKHHHGSPNGKGFGTGSNKVTSLSKIFMLSCDFAAEVLAYKEKGGAPRPIINNLYKKYDDPEIQESIKTLQKTLESRK